MPRRKVEESSSEDEFVPDEEEVSSLQDETMEEDEDEEFIPNRLAGKKTTPKEIELVEISVKSQLRPETSTIREKVKDPTAELERISKSHSKRSKAAFVYGNNEAMLVSSTKYSQDMRKFDYDINKAIVVQHLKEQSEGEFCYNYKQFDRASLACLNKLFKSKVVSKEEMLKCQQYLADHFKFRMDDGSFTKHELKPDEVASIKKFQEASPREAFLINARGIITALNWLNRGYNYKDHKHYLIVATVNKHNDKMKQNIDPNLSFFKSDFPEDYYSFMKVFEVDSETQKVCLYKSWAFKKYGPIRHVKSAPLELQDYDTHLGLIGALFSDGVLRFFNIDKNKVETEYLEIIEPSLEIRLPEPHKITAFDFVNSNTVVVGTQQGYLAEYVLYDKDEETRKAPSFFVRKHFQSIRDIIVQQAVAGVCNDLIITQGFDSFIKFTDRLDVNLSSFTNVRKKLLLHDFFGYIPHLFSVAQPLQNIIRAFGFKDTNHSHSTHQNHLKGSLALSFAASHLHTFIVSGATNGEVMLSNAANNLLDIKSATKYSKQVRLWRFEYNQTLNTYKISSGLVLRPKFFSAVTKKDKDSRNRKLALEEKRLSSLDQHSANSAPPLLKPIPKESVKKEDDLDDSSEFGALGLVSYPANSMVTNIAWCEDLQGFSWYATSIMQDLVVIDKLMEKNTPGIDF